MPLPGFTRAPHETEAMFAARQVDALTRNTAGTRSDYGRWALAASAWVQHVHVWNGGPGIVHVDVATYFGYCPRWLVGRVRDNIERLMPIGTTLIVSPWLRGETDDVKELR